MHPIVDSAKARRLPLRSYDLATRHVKSAIAVPLYRILQSLGLGLLKEVGIESRYLSYKYWYLCSSQPVINLYIDPKLSRTAPWRDLNSK